MRRSLRQLRISYQWKLLSLCICLDIGMVLQLLDSDRYMRTFIRSLTKLELEIAYQVCRNSYVLVPDIEFKIVQASEGYDRFMAKRGWV